MAQAEVGDGDCAERDEAQRIDQSTKFYLHDGRVLSLRFDADTGIYDVVETNSGEVVLEGVDGKEAVRYASEEFNKQSPLFRNKKELKNVTHKIQRGLGKANKRRKTKGKRRTT